MEHNKKVITIDQLSVDFGEVELKISQFSIHVSKESSKINHHLSKGVKVNEGESFTLICSVIGDPIPRIYWYHNNKLVDRQWFRYTNHEDSRNTNTSELKFQFANATLSGNYTCHAENPHGHVRKSVFVKVIQNPSTTRYSISKPVMVSSSAVNNYVCTTDKQCGLGRCLTSIDSRTKKIKKICQCPINLTGIRCEFVTNAEKITSRSTVFNIQSSVLSNPCEISCRSAITNVIIISGLGSILMVLILFLAFTLYFSRKKISNERNILNSRIQKSKSRQLNLCLPPKPTDNIYMENFFCDQNAMAPCYYLNRNNDKLNHDSYLKHINIYSLNPPADNCNPGSQENQNQQDNKLKSNNLKPSKIDFADKSQDKLNEAGKLSSFSVVQNLFVKN